MDVSLGFVLKKALGLAFMPLTVCLLFFLTGLVYLLLRRSRDAVAPFVIGSVLLYIFSLNSVAGYLIRPLESAYPSLDVAAVPAAGKGVKWVVVLGHGHWTMPGVPAAAMLSDAALYRLVEGVRVANAFPGAVLVLSGGRYRDEQSTAQVMAAAALGLGFDPGRIMLSDQALDTHDEAMHLKDMIGADPFVLVTSASHMTRAVKLFQKQGLSPVPAPTHYRHKGEPELFLPHPGNILTCHMAVHEYLGLTWAFLRGHIGFDYQ